MGQISNRASHASHIPADLGQFNWLPFNLFRNCSFAFDTEPVKGKRGQSEDQACRDFAEDLLILEVPFAKAPARTIGWDNG